MDNLEALNLDELSVRDPAPQNIDVIQLSPELNEAIAKLESQAIIGDGEFIHRTIVTEYPLSYELGKVAIDSNTETNPAWGFYFSRHNEIEYTVVANTDIIKDARILPALLRHEAVEGVMMDREPELEDAAHQIGIDPEIIRNDPYNGIAHYVALYHELKLAHDMGVLDEQIEFRRKIVGSIVKDVFMPMSKQDGKETFKSSAGEYARLNFIVPRQMAERIRAGSK